MNRAHVMTSLRWSVVALAGLLFVQPVAGVDGVIQINQARALAGGVTPSDAPGFPVTLDTPGSYVLTGDLDLPDEWTTAVVVEADEVSLDLNGFTLRGPVECTGSSGSNLVCTPSSGDGNGVEISGYGTAVRNGTVSGMVNGVVVSGTFATTYSATTIEGVTVTSNRMYGLALGRESRVADCVLTRNGLSGAEVGDSSTIIGCTASRNGSAGFWLHGGVISGCAAIRNGFVGIKAAGLVTGCEIAGNHSYGVWLAGQAINNRIFGNTDLGINDDGLCACGQNTIVANNGGSINPQISDDCVEIGTNLCGSSTVCP